MRDSKVCGKCKSLPLHLAARYGLSMESVKILVNKYPGALKEYNSFGETPFAGTYHFKVRHIFPEKEIYFFDKNLKLMKLPSLTIYTQDDEKNKSPKSVTQGLKREGKNRNQHRASMSAASIFKMQND